jgi:hypothetical protein
MNTYHISVCKTDFILRNVPNKLVSYQENNSEIGQDRLENLYIYSSLMNTFPSHATK